MHPIVALAPGLCRNRDATISREWLVTNGIGGYAMGTVEGTATRAYHGYLLAATAPPVGRVLLWHGVEEFVGAAGQPERPLLDRDMDQRGRGEHGLEQFALDGTLPVWIYRNGDAVLEKRLWMAYGANTIYLRYRLLSGTELRLRVALLANDRDHHGASVDDGTRWSVTPLADRLELRREGKHNATPWLLVVDPPHELTPGAGWRNPHWLAVEAERGLTAWEQAYEIGWVSALLREGATLTLIASTEPAPTILRDGAAVRARASVGAAGCGERDRSVPVCATAGPGGRSVHRRARCYRCWNREPRPQRHRRVSLVRRLGPRCDDQPARSMSVHGAVCGRRADTADLCALRIGGDAAQSLSGCERGAGI